MPKGRAFLSLNLAHFFDHYVLLILPIAALAIGADYADALSPATWAFVAFAIATMPVGWLGDRWGRVPLMRLFWFGTGAGCLVAGLAPGAVGLAVGMLLIGGFAAIYHPVATAMVMGVGGNAGHALAVNGVWGNMGVAAASITTAALVGSTGWRAAFVLPGVVMILLGLLYARIPAAEQAVAADTARTLPSTSTARWRVLAFIAISGLLGGLIFNAATIALPKLLAERLPHLGLVAVGGIAATIFAAAAFAQLPVGRLVDRIGARPLLLAVEGAKTPLLLAVALAPGALGTVLALPVMLLVFGEIPITAWLLGRYLDERWWSRAYAAQYVLSLGVAAATVPLIAALHRATGDQTTLFLLLAGCSATILAATFLVPSLRATAGPALTHVRESSLAPAAIPPS